MVIQMLRNCSVILNNELVTVIDFDGQLVQIPSIKRDAEFVNVLFDDGQYVVVSDDFKESQPERATKKRNKKTTNRQDKEGK